MPRPPGETILVPPPFPSHCLVLLCLLRNVPLKKLSLYHPPCQTKGSDTRLSGYNPSVMPQPPWRNLASSLHTVILQIKLSGSIASPQKYKVPLEKLGLNPYLPPCHIQGCLVLTGQSTWTIPLPLPVSHHVLSHPLRHVKLSQRNLASHTQ